MPQAQLSEVCMLCRPMSARHLLRRGIPNLHSNWSRTLAIAVLNSDHVSTVLTLPPAFLQPLSAPNIRMLAAMTTSRQDAGGSCPELFFLKEACLEASFLLAVFWWPWERGSNVIQDFHEYCFTAPRDTTLKPTACPWHPISFWQTCLVRMFVTVSAGSVELWRTTFQLISERDVPQRESFQLGTQVWKCSSIWGRNSSEVAGKLLRSWTKTHLPLAKLASRIEWNPLEAKHIGG